MIEETLTNLRNTEPLIHNITNYVTVNDVANALLACGASPIMSDEPEDVEDITSICSGLNINIGTLNKRSIEGMVRAGKKAGQLGHIILLDPVGAGASQLRTKTALDLIDKLELDAIKGNISEIKTLALGSNTTKGVDANIEDEITEDNLEEVIEFVKDYAKEVDSIIVITGAIDLIADPDRCYVVYNGRPEMSKITGTGCQLSGIITAFLAANPERKLESAAAAVCSMGVAGEIAYENMEPEDGNATYRNRIIDAIYHLDEKTLKDRAKYEVR